MKLLIIWKRIHQTIYKNVEIPTLQLNKKFIDIIDGKSSIYVTIPLQYSTPKNRRSNLSFGRLNFSKICRGNQKQTFRTDFIIQGRRENKGIKSQMIKFKEKQSITKKENKQIELKLEILKNQIQSIQMQLLLSQEKEINIQTKVKEINQTNKTLQKEENKKVYIIVQSKFRKTIKRGSTNPQFQQNFQNNNSHKKLLESLQKEIQQIENKKYNVVNDVPLNQNIVMVSESWVLMNTFTEEDISSIKSFRSEGNQKNKSCESFSIF
ncbi:unnamed protein product [Paramecium primaurelia]|uniref:Uncharacterized protein n=1 Tax=Paramecium primaurelia TaxID=5886 RepID=A0A8S1L6R6_PARPR|nr:unnamed protein product [Paramecium primaurelia]